MIGIFSNAIYQLPCNANQSMKRQIIQRSVPKSFDLPDYLHPVVQRIYAARGVESEDDLDYSLNKLQSFKALKNINVAVELLARAISTDKRILIVADFDADGATSCAVAVRCLKAMGAKNINYIVPNRFEFGYGLTPEIVDVAQAHDPDLIITVDNGISSISGVKHARDLGMEVLVTDHHLPGPELPDATVIVNPNQPDDDYVSKNLAGVGVIFNIMIALRAHLRDTGWFQENLLDDVNLAQVLDLVALGTVADVVPLDYNNRIMVSQGLARIRSGNCSTGILALLNVANRSHDKVTASDLGFVIGPRLNAAGRLTDMSLGIECLLTDDHARALEIAGQLNDLNLERRKIQQEMEISALDSLELKLDHEKESLPAGLCLYDAGWHQGVVGILASRIKERYHRPVIVFAPDKDDLIKGSARSITGVHIRDVLEAISTKFPDVIVKFGGHAMAAGLTLEQGEFSRFQTLFAEEVSKQTDEGQLNGILVTDGELSPDDINLTLAQAIRNGGPWGQGFPQPSFTGVFNLVDSRIVGEKHLKLTLGMDGCDSVYPAIAFNFIDEKDILDSNTAIHAVYQLDINHFRGRQSVQLVLEKITPCENTTI